ncbi:MAG: hypothetical protein QMD03_09640 [Syntrophales bacterium]|nr:hypothetical protein [Syntrophales bacterium]
MSTPVFYASLVAAMEDWGYDLKNLSGSMINEPMYMSIAVYDFDPETPFDPLDEKRDRKERTAGATGNG